MGGARAILATGTSGNAMGSLVPGLAAHGKLIVVGVPQDQIQLNAFPLVFGGRSIYGSLTGTPIDGEDTLAFSVLENIRPMIETLPLEQAADAYARMMQGTKKAAPAAPNLTEESGKMIRKLYATDDNTATVILRLVLGLVFFAHGAQKMLG